jgi:hypothetical protein
MTNTFGQKHLRVVRSEAGRLVLPSLVPIYTKLSGKKPDQTGTGFLIDHRGRPLLVTAAHCLFRDR